jgi:AbiV family abortive infection protein
MNKRLNQYSGALTPSQIADGMNAARNNASRLLKDAKLLAEHERFPSAAALAILSIEESGKDAILRELSYATDPKAIKEAWRRYRSHTSKNVTWAAPELVAKGARDIEDFQDLFSDAAEHPFVLDQLKQIAIYSDCLGSAHWSKPESVISKDLALGMVANAELFASRRTTTAEEIELWVEYMGPVLRDPKSEQWIKKAFQNWYSAATKRGFIDANDPIMKRFVFGSSEEPKRD